MAEKVPPESSMYKPPMDKPSSFTVEVGPKDPVLLQLTRIADALEALVKLDSIRKQRGI